ASKFRHWAHVVEERHLACQKERPEISDLDKDGRPDEVSFGGQILHFLGEIEAIFGIWVIALAGVIIGFKGIDTAVYYIGHKVNYTEPLFVVVIMTLASTRPILRLSENGLAAVARIGGSTPGAWWVAILVVAPVLGSLITEPAAMTIGALLLAKQFYALDPSPRLKYATIGLLFVNISVGGTFTHFAAPPVLMVAAPWGWDIAYMFTHFGWRALIGIIVGTALYWAVFRKELASLAEKRPGGGKAAGVAGEPIPVWITLVCVGFMAFTVWRAHDPALFIGAFLFFLAFAQATAHHQGEVDIKPALLVGFFLAGLVNHGGVQGWWIQPVLSSLSETPLFLGATILTAFNDNAAITYLATLVPDFTDTLKYAVVAGAVTGGGLTVIANAPNPAGQSILQKYFGPGGVSPLGLAFGAIIPTIILGLCYMLL
ncbi:MAG TPA: putative Na+/H+ antiporter, partial [Opitutaceae bacterium]